jgi:hypothetical protein
MSGPKNQDKSLYGLSVGLGIAGTIAATVIVFAYAASDGSSYLPVPAVPSEDTAIAKESSLPDDDTKQELQLVQDKTQDQIAPADKIVTEQQTDEAVETQKPANVNSVGYGPADADKPDDSSSPKRDDVEPVNNDENRLTPPLPTLPLLEGENGDDDHHKKGEAKEHKDKKHDHDDSIASIVFKGDKHQKGN